MEILKPICQLAAVAGIILALLAYFVFKSKKIRITGLALGLLAAIGVWAIERFVRFPISEADGSATLLFQWDGAEMAGKSSGSGNSSTVEIFRNDTCLLKMGSSRTSRRGLEKSISVFKNEYSLSVPGSYANADLEDMNEIDSLVISDPDFRSPVELIDGRLDLKLNGEYSYRIGIDRISYENKRVKIPWEDLDRLRIKPEGKTDFGGLTLGDKEIAGAWIGSGNFPEGRVSVTAILDAELKEDHTYSATFKGYFQPLALLHTKYKESGFWKAEKGGIQVRPENCQAFVYRTVGLMAVSGLERIPCDRKHAMAFDYSGDSLNIGTLTDGKFMTFPLHRL